MRHFQSVSLSGARPGFTFTNRLLGNEISVSPQGCTSGFTPTSLGSIGMLAPKVFVYWDRRGRGEVKKLPELPELVIGKPAPILAIARFWAISAIVAILPMTVIQISS